MKIAGPMRRDSEKFAGPLNRDCWKSAAPSNLDPSKEAFSLNVEFRKDELCANTVLLKLTDFRNIVLLKSTIPTIVELVIDIEELAAVGEFEGSIFTSNGIRKICFAVRPNRLELKSPLMRMWS